MTGLNTGNISKSSLFDSKLTVTTRVMSGVGGFTGSNLGSITDFHINNTEICLSSAELARVGCVNGNNDGHVHNRNTNMSTPTKNSVDTCVLKIDANQSLAGCVNGYDSGEVTNVVVNNCLVEASTTIRLDIGSVGGVN